uniref:Replication-associated recombination protein A n=1 Tax=candidate division WOR-3 bacterium TaxID=2052148 RepID=A0A7C6A9K1_UNCW3
MELFSDKTQFDKPLADRLRPKEISEIIGQDHLLGKGKPLRTMIEKGELHSMIFWGPPGSGKTTLALLIAQFSNAHFVAFSAVTSGVADIRNVIKQAEYERRFHNKRTILFVDEIHRFNKAQQDAFLPYVESGKIVLIGATTENPSFEVIAPLLSRSKVYVLHQLSPADLKRIMRRALDSEIGLKKFNPVIDEKGLDYIALISDGDARRALNTLELAVMATEPDAKNRRYIKMSIIEDVVQRKFLLYDKSGEEHYNLISALHKSLRDSDPDAAVYWLARMLEAGEDPLYIARRLVRFASEDIGNADPQALVVANAAKEVVDFVGMPECNTALAQACIYLALAPKSNAVYKAYEAAKKDALETIAEPVPLHLRNPVTPLMKRLGYGKGYKYAHNYPQAKVNQEHLPKSLRGRRYYFPTDRGFEANYKKK